VESFLGLKYLYLIYEFMIKSSLVLVGSLLLVFLFRKKSASTRHFLLSISLISLLLLPFLSTFVTGWQTQLLPSWQTQENGTFNIKEGNQNKGTLYQLNQKDPAFHAKDTTLSGLENASIQNKRAVSQKTLELRTILGMSLIAIWTAGLAFLLFRIFLGLYGAHRLTQQGKQISGLFWQVLLQRFLEAVSIRRKISLLSHDQVRIPLTWGVFKPVVIMPSRAENWNRDECSSALFHELSHVKRSDFLFKILARLSCAFYWFNPLSWFVFRLMREEQEKACDELVLKAGVKPSMYAANLLSIQKAGKIQQNPPFSVLGAVGKSQLNERLLAILKHQLNPKEVKMKTKILLSFLVVAAITFIGLARPAQSSASSTAISLDNNELMTEIQNSPQAENIQEEQQKKKTEAKEEKESIEKQKKKGEITWILKEGKKVHISFKVDMDEEGNKIIVTGKPILIVKEDQPEKGLILSISGKDVVLKKGDEGLWTLKADKLYLIHEGKDKVIKLDEDTQFSITIEKGEDEKKIHIIEVPEIRIKKEIKIPKSFKIHVEEGKKTLYISPDIAVSAVPVLDIHPLLHLKIEEKKLREKLEELRDKLKKIKELQGEVEEAEAREQALKAVEEVLEELREKLEKKNKELEDIQIQIKTDVKHKLVNKIKNLKSFKHAFVWTQDEDDKKIIGIAEKDGGFQIIIKNELSSENKAKYEEILEKIKEDLPEDYEAEYEIDEEENTITYKITTEKKDEKSEIEVKEIVKKIVDELKKIEKKII
jgi:beta-lactamase regulating signal transducer with metallopeptidase domain